MSPVVYVVLGAILVIVALLVIVGIIRTRLQNPLDALESLRADLGKGTRNGGLAEVSPGSAYPFSEEMIKEAAALEGYEFVDVFNRNGVNHLRFRAARRARNA
ncbi:MAG: hypothetical protein ACRDQF_00670 [Thermocrispum sp.]